MQEFEDEHKRDIDEVRQRVQELPMALSTRHTDALTTNARYGGARTDINVSFQC